MTDDLPPFGGLTPAGTVVCKSCGTVIAYSVVTSQWLDDSGTPFCAPSPDGDVLGHDPGWAPHMLAADAQPTDFREWLLEQISLDDDQAGSAFACLAEGESWSAKWSRVIFTSGAQRLVSPPEMALVATFDPARAIAEGVAKREVLLIHGRKEGSEGECDTCGDTAVDDVKGLYVVGVDWPCRTLRAIASAYSDRPGYQDAWRLDG